jgi:hypothetical protein
MLLSPSYAQCDKGETYTHCTLLVILLVSVYQDVDRVWQHDLMKCDSEYEEDNKICCDG